eukprot:CAMPEP_0197594126 /NCGR_PEP_ID=MMETSP1326-20131121/19806_1 /TAXON_ID=1155430 /ORGANISM="Genus nov. species nov., Strain RCC2288" /LENGTH=38 /DNA_ID= /DNA_START= /DNA_END= /DNA_ORIENTATION=
MTNNYVTYLRIYNPSSFSFPSSSSSSSGGSGKSAGSST